MFHLVSKILSFLIHPISWIVLLLILAILHKRRKGSKRLLIGALAILLFFSNEYIFCEFSRVWEYPMVTENELADEYEVAIILGGMVTFDPDHDRLGFHENIDRLLIPLVLYQEGRISKMLISGGSGDLFTDDKEADLLLSYLTKIGIPKADIIVENESKNTYQNAAYSAKRLHELGYDQNLLLVTSSTHMKRAALCFQKAGVSADLFAVDHVAGPRKPWWMFFKAPRARVMERWYWLIHEWVGIQIYRLQGYC